LLSCPCHPCAIRGIIQAMIPTMPFGRTGHLSTRTLFGAAALGSTIGTVSQEDADRTLEVLLRHGVNHIDVAASYGDGEAERRIGPWMREHRGSFFLATKTGKRTSEEAKEDFAGSLKRLQVEAVDLIQLHNLTDPEEWEIAMGDGGALEALVELRREGRARFIGVTGHGFTAPRMHLRSLERFDFDSVLCPYNFVLMQDPDYARDFEALVQECRRRSVAVQTIKSIALRPWPGDRKMRPWYEPLEDRADIAAAVGWALGNPDVFINTVSDIDLLPRILEAAASPLPRPADVEMCAFYAERGARPIFDGRQPIMP